MTITQEMRDVAADELGHEVEDAQINNACNFHYRDKSEWLNSILEEKTNLLHENGGRGVELADEIDNIRIVLALRRGNLIGRLSTASYPRLVLRKP